MRLSLGQEVTTGAGARHTQSDRPRLNATHWAHLVSPAPMVLRVTRVCECGHTGGSVVS